MPREDMRAHRKRESVISCADSVGSGLLVLPSSVLTSLAGARGAPASSISSRAWKAAALVRSCGDSLAWARMGSSKGNKVERRVQNGRKWVGKGNQRGYLSVRFPAVLLLTSNRSLRRSMMPSRASCRKRVSSSWEGKGASTWERGRVSTPAAKRSKASPPTCRRTASRSRRRGLEGESACLRAARKALSLWMMCRH